MRNRVYQYRLGQSNQYPKIEFDSDEWTIPSFVCKYYSINERNIAALLGQKLFVSSPDQLNDLFDTLFLRIGVDPTHASIYKDLIENVGLEFNTTEFKTSTSYREKLRNTLFAIWNSKIGILSTTDKPFDDLMWAHYTNNEGFQVQFDHTFFPENFGKPIPVSYLRNDEFAQTNYDNIALELFINSLLKKELWRYESEFRFIVFPRSENTFYTGGRFSNEYYSDYTKESRLQRYPIECIRKVLLGFNFFRDLLISNTEISFGRPGGLLKKDLIDFLYQNKIDVELLSIDHHRMELVPRKFELAKETELEYKIRNAR